MSKKKESIYVLLEGECISVYFLESPGSIPITPLTQVLKIDSMGVHSVDECFEFLKRYNLSIDRYFYGISGHVKKNFPRHYFKIRFNGAHNLGAKAIKIKLAQWHVDQAERYHSGYSILTNFKTDEFKAVEWYKKALEWWPHPGAMLSLAYCYAFGARTEKQVNQAIELFERVTLVDATYFHKQSDRKYYIEIIQGEAYYYLGYIFKIGLGIPIDLAKSQGYFQLGKELKNRRCEEELMT